MILVRNDLSWEIETKLLLSYNIVIIIGTVPYQSKVVNSLADRQLHILMILLVSLLTIGESTTNCKSIELMVYSITLDITLRQSRF